MSRTVGPATRTSRAAVPRLPATKIGVGPDGADIYRPIIIVTIEIGGLAVQGPALVDSGADNTLVPFDAVAALGVDFAKLPDGYDGSGAGGVLKTKPCKGIIRWGKVELMTEFTLAEPGKGPDQVLLGRADFFKIYVPRFHWHKVPPVFDLDPVAKGR